MIKRKLYTFLITSPLTAMILTILTMILYPFGPFMLVEVIKMFMFTLLIAAPVIFVVGILISILSDLLTMLISSSIRSLVALFIHVSVGFLISLGFDPILNAPIYYWAPLIASFIFWLVDEVLRRKMKTKNIVPVHYQM